MSLIPLALLGAGGIGLEIFSRVGGGIDFVSFSLKSEAETKLSSEEE